MNNRLNKKELFNLTIDICDFDLSKSYESSKTEYLIKYEINKTAKRDLIFLNMRLHLNKKNLKYSTFIVVHFVQCLSMFVGLYLSEEVENLTIKQLTVRPLSSPRISTRVRSAKRRKSSGKYVCPLSL